MQWLNTERKCSSRRVVFLYLGFNESRPQSSFPKPIFSIWHIYKYGRTLDSKFREAYNSIKPSYLASWIYTRRTDSRCSNCKKKTLPQAPITFSHEMVIHTLIEMDPFLVMTLHDSILQSVLCQISPRESYSRSSMFIRNGSLIISLSKSQINYIPENDAESGLLSLP